MEDEPAKGKGTNEDMAISPASTTTEIECNDPVTLAHIIISQENADITFTSNENKTIDTDTNNRRAIGSNGNGSLYVCITVWV